MPLTSIARSGGLPDSACEKNKREDIDSQ